VIEVLVTDEDGVDVGEEFGRVRCPGSGVDDEVPVTVVQAHAGVSVLGQLHGVPPEVERALLRGY
jgi:hypothetical protein